GGQGGAAADAAAEAGEARPLSTASQGGGVQARAAVVAAADLGLAGADLSARHGDACVARDDLLVALRAVTRRVAQGTHPLPAASAHQSPPARPQRDEWAGS